MVKFSKIIALASIGLLGAAAANAAEPGAFYVKGDVQYLHLSSPKMSIVGKDPKALTATIKSSNMSGMGGNLGFGYNLCDDMRSDVTIGLQKGKLKHQGYVISSKNVNLMVNGYYDFNNSTKFTPFVFAGIGLSRASSNVKFDSSQAPAQQGVVSPIKSKTKNKFAYKVGAGFAVELMPSAYLDVAYGFENKKNPNFKPVQDSNKDDVNTSVTTSYRHTVSAGVRISF